MFSQVTATTKGSSKDIVVFVVADGTLPEGTSLEIKTALESTNTTPGEMKEIIHEGGRLFLVSLSKETDLFDATGPLGRRLAQLAIESVAIYGDNLDYSVFGCGFGVLSWNPVQFKGSATATKERPSLTLILNNKDAVKAFEKGQKLAISMNLSRDLSITPPNIATPDYIANLAEKLAKDLDLKCTVMRGKELEKERMEGHINVGKASENLPCVIRLEYRPKGAKGKPVVLVGKTITYDTGGLSLKPREGMVGMKQDKDGGCAVLGAMHAIATVFKPNVPVVALLCAAENCVSDEAYRPDDVLTFRNGVTVEVTNTDAEGRLVLADGLCWAFEKEDPSVVIDIATLTGGVVTALGKVYAGGFSNHDDTFNELAKLGEEVGEKVWRLPLNQAYRDMMKSPVADILNSNANRQAHPVQGAAFLSYFVNPDVPWIHLDIAGVHNSEKEAGPFVKGPNAWGVCLLAAFASSRS